MWPAALEAARGDEYRYRSVLVLLKYGRDGPAIMTTAITNPASNETVSINILLTHFARIRSSSRARICLLPWLLSYEHPLIRRSRICLKCFFRYAGKMPVF